VCPKDGCAREKQINLELFVLVALNPKKKNRLWHDREDIVIFTQWTKKRRSGAVAV